VETGIFHIYIQSAFIKCDYFTSEVKVEMQVTLNLKLTPTSCTLADTIILGPLDPCVCVKLALANLEGLFLKGIR